MDIEVGNGKMGEMQNKREKEGDRNPKFMLVST